MGCGGGRLLNTPAASHRIRTRVALSTSWAALFLFGRTCCAWLPLLRLLPLPPLPSPPPPPLSQHVLAAFPDAMDARQPAPPPFTRPPDRPLIHNPSLQPTPFSPSASQPPQLHVPFAADPYATSRRDPFLPQGPRHVRRSSHRAGSSDGAPQAYAEPQGGWTNTGTDYGWGSPLWNISPTCSVWAAAVSSGGFICRLLWTKRCGHGGVLAGAFAQNRQKKKRLGAATGTCMLCCTTRRRLRAEALRLVHAWPPVLDVE